ncbi:putative diguanylate cyclase AdrA [Fundidesulfovibrio magnetotacticus]|uniref:diguanylate cyclase n=1 Tax=Fundidesulfovibrio magnetotacticus TaxID=2730080 RepID=A0A6V8LQP1_9BACT|nr:GGDEF domain-containing protein [Fundidesulfovibrio magnetotacticus]GFK94822.1 putative diguanylate cyclase AdrA [Fundidesulfovibrio magnetotacticus]
MLHLDAKTVAVIGIILHVALALVLMQTYLTRKTYPGFLPWIVSQAMWVVGSAAVFLRGAIGEVASVIVGNAAYLAVMVLLSLGHTLFYGYDRRGVRLKVHLALSAVILGVAMWFLFANNSLQARIVNLSLGLALLLLDTAAAPLLHPVGRRYSIQASMSACYFLVVLCLLGRAVATAGAPGISDMLSQDAWLTLVLSVGLVSMVFSVYGFVTLTQSRVEEELLEAQASLRRQAETDPLTGLNNRRAFDDIARHDERLTRRYGQRLSLVLFDLDDFKAVNDTHGHQAGDAVLAAVARICRESVRDVDTLCRWGGEEFALLMPQTGLAEAREAACRLQQALGELRLPELPGLRVTASFGVAELDGEPFAGLLARADRALYTAKGQGKNRVDACDPQEA